MFTAPRVALAAIALTASTLTIAAPADAATVYRSCDALHRVWPNGVAKSYSAAMYQVRTGHYKPAYGSRAQSVYWANRSGRDRDKDGTACEVTR